MKKILNLILVFTAVGCGSLSESIQRNYQEENSVTSGQVLVIPTNLYSATVVEDGFYYAFDKIGENSLQINPKGMLAYLVGPYYILQIPRNENYNNSFTIESDFKTFITNGFDKRTNKTTEYLTIRDTTINNYRGIYFEIFVPGNIEITTSPSGAKSYNVYLNHFCYSGVFLKGVNSFMWITKTDPIMIDKYERENIKFNPKTREMFLKFINGITFIKPF